MKFRSKVVLFDNDLIMDVSVLQGSFYIHLKIRSFLLFSVDAK